MTGLTIPSRGINKEDCHTVRDSMGHHMSDKYNPAVQKGYVNDVFLNTVIEKVTALVNGAVTKDKLPKVIVIARDRLANYKNEGGDMNVPVVIKDREGKPRKVFATVKDEDGNIKKENGKTAKIPVETVAGLALKIQNFIDAYYAAVEAYDAAERERMRNSYTAKRAKRR